MTGTLRIFRAELYRTLRAPGTWAALAFVVLVAALRVLAARAAEATERAQALAAGRSIAGLESGRGWSPFVDGWRAALAVATLLLLIHAARSIAADRESGVARLALTRSATRAALVLGRVMLAPFLVLTLFVASGLAALFTARAFYDFGPLVEEGFELWSAAELRGELTVAALAAVPPLCATYAFGLLVSVLCRSAVGAVGAALASFLAFDLFKEVLGAARDWVFAAFVPSFVDRSALSEMAGVARGFSDAGYSEALLNMNLWLPWPEALVMVVLACLWLARKPF